MMTSETKKHRSLLAPFCRGNGIDIGSGGDPIIDKALSLDLPEPYARCGDRFQWSLDATTLPFRDGVLDYVYSSHVLEDFDDTAAVLVEWARVVKPGGLLVLLLPDEQRYRAYCTAQERGRNANHKHEQFGLDYVKRAASADLIVEREWPSLDEYSFAVVFRKE